jgi:hypothetical protein
VKLHKKLNQKSDMLTLVGWVAVFSGWIVVFLVRRTVGGRSFKIVDEICRLKISVSNLVRKY